MERTPLLEQLGTRIRRLRNERGLKAREVAERSGLSPRFFSQLEAGEANISIARLASVAEALGTSVSNLVSDTAHSDRPPKRIALLGLRGAGKSTLGEKLAQALGVPFVELDDRIEEAAGLDLPEIFALHGEEYYRRLEAECLEELVRQDSPCVAALPGGVVHNPKAAPLVFDRFLTIWLRARPEDHMQRVLDQGDRRPMANRVNAMAELRSILASRNALYGRAAFSIDTSGQSPDELVRRLGRSLARAGWHR